MRTNLFVASVIFCLTGAVQAHQIWIEQPTGQTAVIRFGEFGDNLRETSPGLLDKFGKPTATLVVAQTEKPAEVGKTADGFVLPFKADAGQTIVAEDAQYPLYSFKQGERKVTNWYHPAARLVTSFAPQTPRLALDLVPTGNVGEFQLFYKGKVKPKAKVVLVTQSGWAKEAITNDQGVVKFDMPWKGLYVAEAAYDDKTPGERQGMKELEKYDGVNYVTTLTYVKTDGLDPLPAGPVAEPNK